MQFPLPLVLLFYISFSNTLFANRVSDDVKNQDSIKIERYLTKSRTYYTVKTDSAIYFANKALQLSLKSNNQKLIINSQIECFYNYSVNRDLTNAKEVLDEAKSIAYIINDSLSIGRVHSCLGYYYVLASKYDSAIAQYNKSLEISEAIKNNKNKINNLIGLGQVYYERGDFELALSKYVKAFQYNKVQDNKNTKLSILISMANIYADEHQREKAISYYNQAMEIAIELKDEDTLSVLYNNLAIIYQNDLNFNKALKFYEKSLAINKKENNKAGVALCLNNIGENYFKMGNTDKAIVFLRESLSTNRQLQLDTEIIYNLETLIQIHLSLGNFNQAYKYLEEGISLTKKLKIKGKRSDLLKLLAEYYNKTGKYQKAYSSMIAYNSLKDSIQQKSRTDKIVELQTQFDSEKKEKENEILRVKNQFTQEKLEQEKMRAKYLYIFSFLALAVILLIIILFRSKIKINNQIKNINGKLEDSNSKLKIMNATKDKFFSIIAHDLRSPFNAILGFSELIKSEVKKGKDLEIIEEYNANINESANSLFTLLENLLQWANDQRGILEFTPTQIDLYELIQSNLALFKLKAADKSIKLFSDIQPNTVAFGDINMVNTIIRNLISNALKFTDENGEIFLSSVLDGDFIHLSVKDSGIGISKNNQDKLFRLDCNFTTTGTKEETGSGLGLILCKEFVKRNGGEIWVESEENKGSKFIFSLKSA
ncbi:tetratricopeptide repeat-containing sensor histidine kinase [Labilibaculum euxinus]|uniref:histidine kinase n=1 Tax=Labilibaculum euxinus TaxID=2686357 RepID=A0A7M4D812_9BACT|nr:tetratricopeptide repeat protein [Labilibaculum euxinus]MUP38791.1 tetratricopeptide repeat protein [Labilibaculum euxinus]MVB07996.1 tetratricopeptide repeat protein [Labilibaculum euxinus]